MGFAQLLNSFPTSSPIFLRQRCWRCLEEGSAHHAPRASRPFIFCFLPSSPTAAIVSSGLCTPSHSFAHWGTACQGWSLLHPGKGGQGRTRGAEDGEKSSVKWSWCPREPAGVNSGLSPSLWLQHWGDRVEAQELLPHCTLPQHLLELCPALLDISVLRGDSGCQAGLQAEELGHSHIQHLEEREQLGSDDRAGKG